MQRQVQCGIHSYRIALFTFFTCSQFRHTAKANHRSLHCKPQRQFGLRCRNSLSESVSPRGNSHSGPFPPFLRSRVSLLFLTQRTSLKESLSHLSVALSA